MLTNQIVSMIHIQPSESFMHPPALLYCTSSFTQQCKALDDSEIQAKDEDFDFTLFFGVLW